MHNAPILALYDQQQRQEIVYPEMRREETADLVRHVALSPTTGNGMVIYSSLFAAHADQTIQQQIAYYNELGQTFEWKCYAHDTPADLHQRLLQHGFTDDDEEAIMVLPLEDAPEKLLHPLAHDIRRITDPDDVWQVATIEEKVWGGDFHSLSNRLALYLQNYPTQLSLHVAYVEGVPASCAWMDFTPSSQFAGLWGGSTLAEYRGRGLYTALVAVRLQEALQRGIGFLTVDASPMSKPILEKLGFRHITSAYACKWKPEDNSRMTTSSKEPD